MKCPICGCQEFYVKDSDDAFETHGFSVASGAVRFAADGSQGPVPETDEATETYCDRCSWHGRLGELKGS